MYILEKKAFAICNKKFLYSISFIFRLVGNILFQSSISWLNLNLLPPSIEDKRHSLFWFRREAEKDRGDRDGKRRKGRGERGGEKGREKERERKSVAGANRGGRRGCGLYKTLPIALRKRIRCNSFANSHERFIFSAYIRRPV